MLSSYPDLPDGSPAPLTPTDIKSVTQDDILYFLDGDGCGGGGHRGGSRNPGKTEYPAAWSDETVREVIAEAIASEGVPRRLVPTSAGVLMHAFLRGIILELAITAFDVNWEITSAYPICGNDVIRNTDGGPVAVPLNVDHLDRILDR
jgi:hypothetical protein